jgi:hypothetical protein
MAPASVNSRTPIFDEIKSHVLSLLSLTRWALTVVSLRLMFVMASATSQVAAVALFPLVYLATFVMSVLLEWSTKFEGSFRLYPRAGGRASA